MQAERVPLQVHIQHTEQQNAQKRHLIPGHGIAPVLFLQCVVNGLCQRIEHRSGDAFQPWVRQPDLMAVLHPVPCNDQVDRHTLGRTVPQGDRAFPQDLQKCMPDILPLFVSAAEPGCTVRVTAIQRFLVEMHAGDFGQCQPALVLFSFHPHSGAGA